MQGGTYWLGRRPIKGPLRRKLAVSEKFFLRTVRGTLAQMRVARLLPFALVALVCAPGAAAGTTPQTIVVKLPAPAAAMYNTAFTVAADSTSGLPVTFSASGACTNAGNRFTMTSGTGACTVMYDQAGDATYAAAPQVVQSVSAQKADQTITFTLTAPAGSTFGDPDFGITAFASSGLDVSFSGSGGCTVNGTTLHITGAGTCTVAASQPGDANFNAAQSVSHSFAIAKASQTIDFEPLADTTVGRAFTARATADSGLRVVFSAKGACTVTGSRVRLTRVGTCTLTARQSGNANFKAARSVTQSFHVAGRGCSVPQLVGKRLGAAKRALVANRCGVGKVHFVHSSAAKRGRVVAQGRRPGRVLPVGSKVDVVVGRR